MGAEGEYSTMVPARVTGSARPTLYTLRAEPGQRDRAMKDAEEAIRKLHNGQVVVRTTTQSEERVKRYEEGIKKGGILMGVRSRSDDDAAFFAEDWKKNRAADVYA